MAMFLGALSILAVLGVRYPFKMLPLLFFELLWKVMWLVGWGLPLWGSAEIRANLGMSGRAVQKVCPRSSQ